MTLKNVAVVGTGMSALGSILALVDAGLKPIVIEAGSLKDIEIPPTFGHLKDLPPKSWSGTDRLNLIGTLSATTRGLPRKLSFGSSAAYGAASDFYLGNKIPAYSHYLGGLSHVWGGSALVTPPEELRNWPIEPDEIAPYFQKCLSALPYAANSSSLDLHFGKPFVDSGLDISNKDKIYLNKLEKNLRGKVFVGQSRLLVHAVGENRCKYCGFCMTGCAYSSIFKSSDMIAQLFADGKIQLLENHILNHISERKGIVILELEDRINLRVISKEFDKVYLGAGAAESSRIILNSVKSIQSVTLHGRGSCVVPLFSFTSLPIQWPLVNTLPAIFIEFLDKKIGSWTHIQMTNQNELIYKAFGYLNRGPIPKWRQYLASNISTLMINDNSRYGVIYTLSRVKDERFKVMVNFSRKGSRTRFLARAFKHSLKIAWALKIVPLVIFTKMNDQTYHLGGSFPMTAIPNKSHETDKLGRLSEFENLHIIDSSSYPSIPSTTLGILLTANAWRITESSL